MTNWNELEEKFLDQFFPHNRFMEAKTSIAVFSQGPNEALNEAWERFKSMVQKCKGHGFDELTQIHIFSNGLQPQPKTLLDATAAQIEELKDELEVEEQKVELKVLPSHLKYVFLEKNENKPVIISNAISKGEEEKLLMVLERNQEAMGWTISDLKGISPSFCMHKILMEDDYKPVAQPQRRLNSVMKEVVRKEVVKILEVGMIYQISDSAWVSPVHVVPKKSGMTVIRNEKINPEDHEKTAFTCPFGIFAYRRMPFGLCNAPATFQRCMQAIFSDLIEKCIEVFMDDFSVFGPSFDLCLKNLDTVLSRCVESNLVLNWEKCNFMVTE
ncbi:uncharacterized protein LOC131637848 [Vicia villosa]|uniref:uncharacterized protein LOC131637848 n=1 Tax=Vicia villosa TaxID=3911 RepID=UPI00273B361E|nr:uncharacterized protein LOC131637848 [Vicia villosa]